MRGEVGDAALVDPAKICRRVKARVRRARSRRASSSASSRPADVQPWPRVTDGVAGCRGHGLSVSSFKRFRHLSHGRHVEPCSRRHGAARRRTRLRRPAIEFPCCMIRRELLANGLRLVTEAMPHVRSVVDRRLADARLAPRTDAQQRHRPLRRAHALQGHRRRARPRTSRRRSTRSAASSTRSRRRNTPATTSRCSTSTCRWPSTSSPTSCLQPGVRARRHRAREEGDPRRDQDGRGHARRSGPRDLRASSSGAAIRSAGRFSARPRRSSALDREGPAASISPRPTSPRTSSSSRSGNLEHERRRALCRARRSAASRLDGPGRATAPVRSTRRRRQSARRISSRATSASARRPFRRTTPIATPATC